MNLNSFVGNSQVKKFLSDAKDGGRFPHAVIFQGEAGTGKKTLAKLVANALVCREENAPCGECPACRRARAGSHPDIRIEEGSGATRSLNVEAAKRIILDSHRMPEEADYNIYLLFVENKMPEVTQNKLLKLIEEPPGNTVFIITVPSAESLLPTIRSRSQIFSLRPVAVNEAADYGRMIGMESAEAERLAALCGGNIGRMLQERGEGEEAYATAAAERIALASAERNTERLLEETAPLIKNRQLTGEVLERLGLILRDGAVLKAGGKELLSSGGEAAEELTKRSAGDLLKLLDAVTEHRKKLERNANMPLLITSLCAALA